MSNIVTITDGEPLTYDFLKSLYDRITSLESRISVNDNKKNQKIQVFGKGLQKLSEVIILCGTEIFDVGEKQENKFNVKFDGANFGDVPHIVATVADTRGRRNNLSGTPYATISIGSVTKGNFECRVDVIKTDAKNTQLQVNYIAIGKGTTR
jgi:hypothetical protein